jgi:hypothetical protein
LSSTFRDFFSLGAGSPLPKEASNPRLVSHSIK